MADTAPTPVIFLAFANSRDETVGYLRNLPVEARRLRVAIERAVQAGLCELEVRTDSTAGDIFKVFQDPRFRNRIAIFHYGGHANGYQLLLESPEGKAATADAGGLAAFLAQQQGLRLVFLNGCSTQQQTQGLLDANIPAVISTSRSIDDQVATDFAGLFYQALAGGVPIRTAYHEAEASVRTAKGGNTRNLYFGVKDDSQSQLEADRWPWNLYLREGSESADQWSLPNAVDDPLFGLPPLPEQDLPETPYRHLNWFTCEHAEIFFGRGHQIRELYNLLTAGSQPIILFYGQSGVGKSSLLDAGLLPRLERNYEVRYLRRGAGGLLATLQTELLSEAAGVPIETAWLTKEEQLHKPLIVFLDQVEEVYTRPIKDLPDELDQLLRVLKATFCDPNRRPKGKLVLGFREEWLAKLESQVQDYQLQRTKMFLKPLDRRGIIEVVQGPTRSKRLRERYALTVEPGLAEIIADDLLADRGSAISTTLQILLSKMWTKATEVNSEPPQFSRDLYLDLKDGGILLGDFLDQQLKTFHSVLPEPADSGLLLDVLALHTTGLGTASQSSVARLLEQYSHVSDMLPNLLQQCQELYLLTEATSTQKETTKSTRLAHDTLAPLVRAEFDKSDRPGQRARRILDNRSVDWNHDREGTPLDEADLAAVESGELGMRVPTPDQTRLITASCIARKRRRWATWIQRAVLTSIPVLIFVALWFIVSQQVDNERQLRLEEEKRTAAVNQQFAKMQWITGTNTRNSAPLNASHYFAKSAEIASTAKDEKRSLIAAVAAQLTTRRCRLENILDHSTPVAGFTLNDERQTVVTWDASGEVGIWSSSTGSKIKSIRHGESINGARFTPNGDWLLTWGDDGNAILWNTENWEASRSLPNGGPVVATAISSDSTKIVCSINDHPGFSDKSTIVLWDRVNGRKIETWSHEHFVQHLDLSRDNWLLHWGTAPEATLYEIQSRKKYVFRHDDPGIANVPSPQTYVIGAAFVAQNQLLTWGNDGTARLWEIETGKQLHKFKHERPVYGAELDTGGYRLLTWSNTKDSYGIGSNSGTVHIWEVDNEKEIESIRHDNVVNGAAYVPSRSILSWTDDGFGENGALRTWVDGRVQHSFGHDGAVMGTLFSDDDRWLVTWGTDGYVKIWDAKDGQLLQLLLHASPVKDVAMSSDRKRLLTLSGDERVYLWSLNLRGSECSVQPTSSVQGGQLKSDEKELLYWGGNAAELCNLQTGESIFPFAHENSVTSAVLSNNEQLVLTTSEDGQAKLWDGSTGKEVWKKPIEHKKSVLGARFRWDDGQFVTWSEDGTAAVWERRTGVRLHELPHQKYGVNGARYLSDGSKILTWGDDSTARLWDARTGGRLAILPHDNEKKDIGGVAGAVFDRDENRILSWGSDRTARIWGMDGKLRQKFRHDEKDYGTYRHGKVESAMFNKGEDKVLTCSADGTARLWDANNGDELRRFAHDKFGVQDARFTRDEMRVLTWGGDRFLYIWDITSGQRLKSFPHPSGIHHAELNGEETILLTSCVDGIARLWDVETSQQFWEFKAKFSNARFIQHGEKVLTWGGHHVKDGSGDISTWKIGGLLEIAPEKTVELIEVLTGTRMDMNTGELLRLPTAEWRTLRQSMRNGLK